MPHPQEGYNSLMPIKNKVLRLANQRRYKKEVWYPANRKRHITTVVKRKNQILRYIRDIKRKSKCSRCSESDPRCLDFHHLNKNKTISLSQAAANGWSICRIDNEVAKCEVLCSNCHRKLDRKSVV